MSGITLVRRGGLAACLALAATWAAAQPPRPDAPPRRPVAAALLADGQTVCVANHRTGSLSLVDLARAKLVNELQVGGRLTGLAVLPDHSQILVTDEERHELVALAFDGQRLTIRERRAVAPYPASVAVQPDGTRATVAGRWSRRVDVIDLGSFQVVETIRLPFAPRLQCVLPDNRVVVADAFGGHLAVVDVTAGRLVAVHGLPGHNLAGLVLDAEGKHLLVAHQILNQRAATTRENIARGVLMANVLQRIPVDRLLDPDANLDEASQVVRLGDVGSGAGDPAGVAVVDADQVAVALAGVHEVALVRGDGTPARRIAVGRRPTAVVAATADRLVVLNTFDDSLSFLDTRRGIVTDTVALGPKAKLDYRERGELLFHDARLSRDGWLSCHSCHTDGHTNGLLADTLGDGTFGTPKRTLTLLHTRMTDPWAWDGSMKYLHDQVEKSLTDTMHAPAVTQEHIADLVSFLHALPPPPAPEPVTEDAVDRAQVERGRQVFEQRGCAHCHIPPLTYSSHGSHDVGFADERGRRTFNAPSLRGVGQGYRFLHDNRAATLEEVFTKFRHQVGTGMTADDYAALLRFLRSL
jgi:DNA-binding beta-propeller fold protein YncE